MLTVVAFVLSFVASTLAYQITVPNANSGWTNNGNQEVKWTEVDTDLLNNPNFTLFVDNQHIQGFKIQQLVALVQGASGSASFPLPSGLASAAGYRVKAIRVDNGNAQLAQSDEFTISSSSSTLSGATGSTTGVVATTSTTGATGISDTTASASDSANALPTTPSAADLSYAVHTGLLGLFSLLGFALA